MSKFNPSKAAPRLSSKYHEKSSGAETSSDVDSYAGVEQISDSEEDEPNVEHIEEQAIISSVDDGNLQYSPLIDINHTWEGISEYPDGIEDMVLFGQDSIDGEWQTKTEQIVTDGESDDCTPIYRACSLHFDSSDDEIEMFDDVFPDIFIDKDKLASSFRRQIDYDVSDDGSYWEPEGADAMYNLPETNVNSYTDTFPKDNGEASESDSSFYSGYESDISGETTDDDLPNEYYTQPRQRTAHSSDVESEGEISYTPRLYSWKHTSDKPFATVSSNCKKMVLFNVRVSQASSLQKCLQQPLTIEPSSIISPSMINSNAGSPSSAVHQTLFNEDLNKILTLGPLETYYPWKISTGEEIFSHGSSSWYDTDAENSSTDATITNLDEFINFESDENTGSDENQEVQSSDFAGARNSLPNKANLISTISENQVHPLLSHFNRGVVGSWRQKQNIHQLLHRNIASPDSLAFGGNQFMEGTLKGVKNGRLRHANTPITPARKQRAMSAVAMRTISLATSVQNKRKHGADDENGQIQKRNRAMV